MSGISGKMTKYGVVTLKEIHASALTLQHRGPDAQDIFLSENQKVGFAQRWLNLADNSQHFQSSLFLPDKRLAAVYDGVLYNSNELRKALIKIGAHFKSNNDSEIILWGYYFWGKDIVKHLNGLFAFALYDELKNQVFLARDRFGFKPLFYSVQNDFIYFGSELKAIKSFERFQSHIEPEAVSLFLANRFVSKNKSMWQDVYKLPAAHFMIVDGQTLSFTIEKYWTLSFDSIDISPDEAQKKFEAFFTSSLSELIRDKANTGAFLSGGFDSSAIVSVTQQDLGYNLHTFSIGFEGWDESEHRYAEMVANFSEAKLEKLVLDKIDLNLMPSLMYHYDDPIADISILPTFLVSQLAAKHVKTVLSGEGADEFLGGYWWQKPDSFLTGRNKLLKWRSIFFSNYKKDIKNHYIQAMSMGLYNRNELIKALCGIYKEAVPGDVFSHLNQHQHSNLTTLKQIQLWDIHHFMGELVNTKIERGSIAHGLQVCAPFLDYKMTEWLFSLPENIYMQKGIQKPLLRNLLKGRVPDEILSRPKQGFVGPDIFYKDYALYKNILLEGRLVQDKVVRKQYISKLLMMRDHWRLWKLFVLEHWWRVWV